MPQVPRRSLSSPHSMRALLPSPPSRPLRRPLIRTCFARVCVRVRACVWAQVRECVDLWGALGDEEKLADAWAASAAVDFYAVSGRGCVYGPCVRCIGCMVCV
jgi:hypothetical protein